MTLGSSERAETHSSTTDITENAHPDSVPSASLKSGLLPTLAVNAGVTAIGAVGVWLSTQLGVGTPTDPGPGLWPLSAALVMVVAGVVTIVNALLGERVGSLRGSAKPLLGLVLTAVFVLLFSFVSVIVSMVVTFALWTRLLGGLSWPKVALSSAVVTVALYLIFGVAIETPFPAPLTAIP